MNVQFNKLTVPKKMGEEFSKLRKARRIIMRGKKLLAFILAAGMAGSALAGCMPGTGATGSEPAAETKQESASGTENVISEEA